MDTPFLNIPFLFYRILLNDSFEERRQYDIIL